MDWKSHGNNANIRVEDIEEISLDGEKGLNHLDYDKPRHCQSRSYPDYYEFYDVPTSNYQGEHHNSQLGIGTSGSRSPSIHSMSAPLLNSILDRNEDYNSAPLGPVDVDSSYSYVKDGITDGMDGHHPPPSILYELNNIGSHIQVGNGKGRSSKPLVLETLYFRDGKRKIDLVLAYEDNGEQSSTAVRKRQRRTFFEASMEEEGLHLELEDKSHSQDGKTYFLKIHGPWEVLTRCAELMNLKMPIKEEDENDDGLTPVSMFPCEINFSSFEYDKELIPDEPHYYTGAFNRERAKQFLIKDKDIFFNNGQRSRMVWDALMRARYDEDDPERMGIQRLLSNGTYLAAFSLHDGSYVKKDNQDGQLTNRRILFQEWAQIRCFYKLQPLPLIRKYFGEKIGIYFAWLGFYTYMLIAPAIVGLLCFFYGLLSYPYDIPTNDICDENGIGNTTMCPICETCPMNKLYSSCDIAKVTYLFDNEATVFFAVFMSFWATLFLEFWKRYQSRIAWEWDLADFEEEEGLNKLQEAQENAMENQDTENGGNFQNSQDKKCRFLPMLEYGRASRIAATGSCIFFMLFVAIGAVLGVISYRIIIVKKLNLSSNPFLKENADWVSSISAATINFMFIIILDKIYHRISRWLTDLEQPRTQTEYEDSFTFKMFLFQFINFYSSLIYIAFCKGRLKADDDGPVMIDQCDPTGCMFELVIQLAIIMAGKQILNNVNEITTPVILNWWRARKSKSRTHDISKGLYTRWEQDYDLAALDRMALFDEYIEMVIQYGFVTLFVSAFPLAPLFAFLNNIVEVRLDAYKFVTQVRRPIAARAQDIGVWYGILKGITILSVISNAFVIAYTSDFIPRMVYMHYYSPNGTLHGYIESSLSIYNTSDTEKINSNDMQCRYVDHKNPPEVPNKYLHTLEYWHIFAARLAFVVVYEHLVFSCTGAISYFIPDVPSNVKALLLREKHLAREALYEAELEKVRRDRVNQKNGNAESGIDSGGSDAALRRAKSQADLSGSLNMDHPSSSFHGT